MRYRAELPVPVPEPVDLFRDDDHRWPATLEGINLRRIAGHRSAGGIVYTRLSVTCSCCCTLSRSTNLLTDALGPQAVLCYLGAWLEQFGELSPEARRRFRLSIAEMRSYLDRKLTPAAGS